MRDPSLEPEVGPVTSQGHKRHDYFAPTVDWDSVQWYPIAVHYDFRPNEGWWDRTAWRRERYQRRKAWKRTQPRPEGRGNTS